ncbi:MAG: tellurite resistance TerB C-terminal domain-containing protein [Janthinobacterium lividum]
MRARNRGRSLLGWGLFALFLWPIALVATWFVGPKKRLASVSSPPAPPQPPNKSRPSVTPPTLAPTPLSLADLADEHQISVVAPAAPAKPLPTPKTADAMIIDVTGPDVPLRFALTVSVTEPSRPPAPAPSAVPVEYGYDMPRLGTQYRQKLSLSPQQVDWLNKFWPPQNVFVAIKGCREATVHLYLQALPVLEAAMLTAGTALGQVTAAAQQQSVRLRKASQGAYSWSEYDERYVREQAEATVYSTIFRRCENVVREAYGNKRRLAAEFSGLDGALGSELERQVGQPLDALLPTLVATIGAPDEATELELNLQNVTRWKQQLDQLATQLSGSTTRAFVEGVQQLGQRNARNPALENIFFDASKLMAKYDREEALRFYVQYVYHDLNSVTINSKPLAKTIQKSLFPQPEQLLRFEAVVGQLARDKDLAQALAQVPTVYARQRRKIELDLGAIQQVQHQHAGTVELLNEYLQDDPEPTVAPSPAAAAELPIASPAQEEEIQLLVPVAAPPTLGSPVATGWGLSATQQALLVLFAEQALVLPQAQVEAFARQHGALRNQLIDSLNEQCYEHLDDVLIEEDGDTYTIYEPYYQQLPASC